MLTTSAAIGDPNLLGSAFSGPSWATWRAVLRAAEGLRLAEDQLACFANVAERDPPTQRVRELWVIAGRRAGKDSIASAIATTAALGDYRKYLRPGERAVVMCLAVDREQARIVLKYIQAYFREIALLKPMVVRETPDGLELTNGVDVIVATNSFRATRGRTLACVILDEVAYWRSEESANPDIETYNAILPGLVTLPGAMLIGISSPYRRSGLLFEQWRKCYGKSDPDVLVVKGPSRTFNPNLPQAVIDAAMDRDPEAAAAEWLAEWRSDLADFVDRAVVDAAVIAGRFELPPAAGIFHYRAFVDPSGGSSDSMTLAIAHRDKAGNAVLDAIRERRPPFSPEGVVEEFAALLKAYHCSRVVGDRYAGEWPREQFRKQGITYETSERTKSAIYLDSLPLLNSAKLELLDHPRLISQLASLERRTARSGRDSIDHPPGSHDDIVNAALGALLLAAGKAGPMVISAEILALASVPVRPLHRGDGYGQGYGQTRAFFTTGNER
jgi:hypothetical protein